MSAPLSRFLVLVAVLVGACSPTGAPPTTAPPSDSIPPVVVGTEQPGPTDGPERLVSDLRAAGLDARLGPLFAGDPLASQGVVLCIASEPVQVYVFGSVVDRARATAKIDPGNPSNMGATMVDWNGRPRMWQRDRLLIVYLGEDAATEAALRTALGDPFASSAQGRPPLREDSCG